MPIIPSIETTRISQNEFKELSYQVMQHVFAIHKYVGQKMKKGTNDTHVDFTALSSFAWLSTVTTKKKQTKWKHHNTILTIRSYS